MKTQNWGIYSGHPKRKAFAVVGSFLWLFLIILGVGGGFERAMAAEMPTIQGVSPVTGVEGQTITLQAGVYDPDSTPPFEYLWRFPDGSTSTNETPSLQLVDSGNVFVQLIVKDKEGQSSMPYLQLIVVSNVPATVLSLGPLTGGEGQTLQLASVLKNAGRPYLRRYEWTLPDGSKSEEVSPIWHFQHPGTYPLSAGQQNEIGIHLQ